MASRMPKESALPGTRMIIGSSRSSMAIRQILCPGRESDRSAPLYASGMRSRAPIYTVTKYPCPIGDGANKRYVQQAYDVVE